MTDKNLVKHERILLTLRVKSTYNMSDQEILFNILIGNLSLNRRAECFLR